MAIHRLRLKQRRRRGHHHLDQRADELVTYADGPSDELISTQQLATWLGVSKQWCELGRANGYGPPFIRMSTKRIRYRRGDVLAWLEERRHASTAEYRK